MQRLNASFLNRWLLLLAGAAFLVAGCSGLSRTEKGAATGAGAGAVVGGAIGKIAGNTAQGAVLGAVVGGAAGAIIGERMDRQAAELEEELEDAEVARVGEGIIVKFDSGILFDFDKAALRAEAQNNLQDLAQSLTQYDSTEVLIVGHTDDVGPDDYNYELSERRAESAAEYLIRQGIRPSRITQMGKGETEPISENDSEAGRQQNRRVEIAIFATEAYRNEVVG